MNLDEKVGLVIGHNMDQPIQYERPCQRFPVRGCGYETYQSLPMLRPAELTEDWKLFLGSSHLARLH
eukprot:scaffold411143_cov35-Attheya_sp.AAC.1